MMKKLAIILEIIPVVSAIIFNVLVRAPFDSAVLRWAGLITMFLGLAGFVFFFIGRKLAGGDKTVLLLGILDWLATAAVISVYVLAIFAIGM